MNYKKLVKELLFLIVSFTLLLYACESMRVSAAEPQWASADVHYTIDDSYMVYIPESITVGENVEISAMDLNISNDKSVVVAFGMFNTDDSFYLHNADEYEETIEVCFTDSEGNTIVSSHPIIGSFTCGNNSPITFSSYIKSTEGARAGDYNGTVTFDIFCE